jgi:tetratricopeptide (TPR) repeat protein
MLLISLLVGCSTLGQTNLSLARQALQEDRPSAALVAATEALKENPKYSGAKNFIRDNTDSALAQVLGYLSDTEKSTAPETLENRFIVYSELKKFYDNLRMIGLPIADGQKLFGLIKSWEWTTPLQDYSPQMEFARNAARAGFYDAGLAAIDKAEIKTAIPLMDKVVGIFALPGSVEQKADKARIAEDFAAWAATMHSSRNVEKLLAGIEAYEASGRYNSSVQKTTNGLAAMKVELSEVYLDLGLKKEKENTIDALKESIELFKKAVAYNRDNTKAVDSIPRARNAIAVLFTNQGEGLERTGKLPEMVKAHELYTEALKWDEAFQRALGLKAGVVIKIADANYLEGIRLSTDRKNAANLEKSLAAFSEALVWVPGYKDALVLKQRVLVSKEVLILANKLATTQTEFSKTHKRLVYLSGLVNKANKGMDDLNYVADAVVQLDEQLMVLGKTTSALSGIPVVGTVISVTGTALNHVHRPVKSVSSKVKRLRAPYITPSRDSMAKVKDQTDKIVSAMDSIGTNLEHVRSITLKLNECVNRLDNATTIAEIERDVKATGKVLDELNSGLNTINDVQNKIEGTLKSLGDSVAVISDVTGGIKTVMTPLNKIKGVTDEIYDILKKKISIPMVGTFTVEQAINSTTGVVKKAAEAVLNPVLKALDIRIPSIPGIDQLDQMLDKMEGYYADVKMAADRIQSASSQILNVPAALRKNSDSILAKSSCSL